MPRRVKIAPGHNQITLPNGERYNAGDEVVLTDAEFDRLAATALGDEVLDLGEEVGDSAGSVPAGGTTGQVLTKASDDDLDTEWATPAAPGGGGGNVVYGDGSDGTVTLPGGTTTLTRDMVYENLTVPSGAVLNPAGFRIFVRNTLTVDAGGTISRNGANASGSTGGTNSGSSILNTGVNGPNSPANAPGNTGGVVAGQGGVGGSPAGAGGSGAGGAGGAAGSYSATVLGGEGGIRNYMAAMYGRPPNSTSTWTGGAAGGSGAGDAGGGGGGGGAGGSLMSIFARTIVNNGTISANGGNGAPGGSGNRGGGGGGGGGCIWLLYDSFTGNAATAAGGSGGAGTGTGTAGGNGSAGRVIHLVNV